MFCQCGNGSRSQSSLCLVLLQVVRVLSLTIASVPVALPLVMNVMMTVGANQMAKKGAIVTHLSALQVR
jgi:magnesium-transporting ATPase (P-type)